MASRAEAQAGSSSFRAPTHVLKSLGIFPIVYPLMDPKMASGFGSRLHPKLRVKRHHRGVDLAADRGAPIRALSGGRVVFADPYSGYGNLVVVQHSHGVTTHYGHMKSFQVRPGDVIAPGAIIGKVGETGITTGPHLHFELRLDGVAQDPEDFVPGLVDSAEG